MNSSQRKKLREALDKDFSQFMINSLTPDRGYPTPVDNVEEFITKLVFARDCKIRTLQGVINELKNQLTVKKYLHLQ